METPPSGRTGRDCAGLGKAEAFSALRCAGLGKAEAFSALRFFFPIATCQPTSPSLAWPEVTGAVTVFTFSFPTLSPDEAFPTLTVPELREGGT